MQLSTPADLLALIPTLMNREPEELLVLITIKDNQMQAALGLEHCPEDREIAEYVSGILAQIIELKPDAMVAVFYTETESDCDHEPYEHVNLLMTLALDVLTPMVVSPSILVKGGRYHLYGTEHWHDITEVKDSDLAASMVLHGIPLQPVGLVIPEPTAVTDEITEAIDARVAGIPDYPEHTADAWLLPYVTEERALYESLLQRGFGATEDEAVRMVACFQNPVLRDRLMVDTITATMDQEVFGDTITGQSEVAPDPDRLEAAVSLVDNLRLEAAVSLVDNLMQWTCDRHRLPLLMVQAWLHWMQGRTLDAEQYLDVACALDPTYTMAAAFRRYIRDIKRLPDCVTHGGPR